MAEYVVERRISISASPAEVFRRVGVLQEWDAWSPWAAMDPAMSKTYSGDPGTVGSQYNWSGNRKVGQGQMNITEVNPDSDVTIDLQFFKPFKSRSVTRVEVKSAGEVTEVTWRMTGEQTFMLKAMTMVGKGMDAQVGPDFEKGLAQLKRISES